MQCLCCNAVVEDTRKRRKFCSRSCAAKTNNKRPKRVRKQYQCTKCLQPIVAKNSRHRKYCLDCWESIDRTKPFELLISDNSRRRYLLKERPHICELCHNADWQGQPIPLDMDHIDGNPTNNNITNLRLICPNCHAQTPTYKAKNKGGGRQKRRLRYAEGKTY